MSDFNAQIKINGESGRHPDAGRIEHNTLINAEGRDTDKPVTSIDLVAANDALIAVGGSDDGTDMDAVTKRRVRRKY